MSLFYRNTQRAKLALLLLILFIAELLGSTSQSNNISELDTTFNEVYSDRLVAQDYIYKMTEEIHRQKYFLLNHPDGNALNRSLHDGCAEIKTVLKQYEGTKLTREEKKSLQKLKSTIESLDLQAQGKAGVAGLSVAEVAVYNEQFDLALGSLKQLSEIQMSRSLDLKGNSAKIVSFSNIIEQMNWVVVIITGLLIQVIVFASRSTYSRFKQNECLN